MDDDPKDVALALLLGWQQYPPGLGYWHRPTNPQDQPDPHGRVWLYPPSGSPIHPSWATRVLYALSANAAVWYDTK